MNYILQKPQYWLWVTSEEYYLDDSGNEREDLNPSNENDTEGWWTCAKHTKMGDLILLYRKTPKKDIAYLIQAKSDAYSIENDDYASKQKWKYGCDYHVLYKFSNPIHISVLKQKIPHWNLLRNSFQGIAFSISSEIWQELSKIIITLNPSYRNYLEETLGQIITKPQTLPPEKPVIEEASVLSEVLKQPVIEQPKHLYKILKEQQLEEYLVNNLNILTEFGYYLDLYQDTKTGKTGRQYICQGQGGRIDLLCFDSNKGKYVVIELKNVIANRNTFGQICSYIGYVKEKFVKGVPPLGLVISRGSDVSFKSCLKTTKEIFHLNIDQLGLE